MFANDEKVLEFVKKLSQVAGRPIWAPGIENSALRNLINTAIEAGMMVVSEQPTEWVVDDGKATFAVMGHNVNIEHYSIWGSIRASSLDEAMEILKNYFLENAPKGGNGIEILDHEVRVDRRFGTVSVEYSVKEYDDYHEDYERTRHELFIYRMKDLGKDTMPRLG